MLAWGRAASCFGGCIFRRWSFHGPRLKTGLVCSSLPSCQYIVCALRFLRRIEACVARYLPSAVPASVVRLPSVRGAAMLVSAEIRTVSTGGIKHKEGLEQHKQSAGGQDGLLYGRLKVAGLHPKLVEVIPSPEDFKSSSHYPLLISNSPFLQQVRGRGRQSRCSLRCSHSTGLFTLSAT